MNVAELGVVPSGRDDGKLGDEAPLGNPRRLVETLDGTSTRLEPAFKSTLTVYVAGAP